MPHPQHHPSSETLDTSTRLALARTLMAGERTWLSWIRTALAIAGTGIVIEKFEVYLSRLHNAEKTVSPAVELASLNLILVGCAITVIATLNLFTRKRALLRGDSVTGGNGLTLATAVVVLLVLTFFSLYIAKKLLPVTL